MDTLSSKDIPEQNQTYQRCCQLQDRYSQVFDFLVLSVAKMLNIEICTICLFDEEEIFVVASNDASVEKFRPISITNNIDLSKEHSFLKYAPHLIEKFDVKSFNSFPVLDSSGIALGSLNLFDNKERVFTDPENEIIGMATQQISRWISIKAKEQELKNLENLFQLSNDLVGINTFDRKFSKLNPAFSKTLGWSDEIFKSGQFNEFLHEDDVERTAKVFNDLCKGKSLLNFTNRYYTKENKLKWIEWTSIPEIETRLIYVIGRDVTKSLEREQLLRKHDNFFQVSNDMIGVCTFEGKYIELNPAFSKTLGWSDSQFMGGNFMDFVFEEDVKKTHLVMKDLANGKSVRNFINRYNTKANGTKWIEWTATPDMETGRIYAIGRDVTEFIKRAELLKKSEQKFHQLFNNIEGMVCIHDLEGNFLDVNPAALKVSGFSKEEANGASLFDLIAPEKQREIPLYLQGLRQNGNVKGEMAVIKKNGEKAVWYFMSTLDKDMDGNDQALVILLDVTEQKQLDFELKRAKNAAEEALKTKTEFVANMSHEIRTPLNGIIGFTELALKTDLNETQRQYLEIINQSGVSLFSIINDILDFSKIESKSMRLFIDKVEVEEVISEALNIVSYGIDKKGLEMLLNIDHRVPKYIWIDALRLKQILVNLLGNALKFTEKGEIKLYIRIVDTLEDGLMNLRFGVKDTGIGVHLSKQEQIFKPFSQEDGSITKKYGGTGLGLTITNKLLALANSKLHLESEQGQGSNFYFDLKVKTTSEKLETSLHDIKRILVVDDNTNNRKILRRMLEIKDIEVEEADNGLKALLAITENSDFDVIIMDYHMPIMDGIETIRKIKEIQAFQKKEQPFIILYSSSDDDQLQLACEELDIKTRLVKPIRMNQMYQVLAGLKNNSKKKPEVVLPKTVDTTAHEIKILIAEDNPVNMTLTKIYATQLLPQAIIIEANNGDEAVSLYQSELPDIILMDIQMPNLNGFEATQKIRALEENIEIPIIALTAAGLPGEKEKCLDAGMSDFLAKPLLRETFADMLKKWLGPEMS